MFKIMALNLQFLKQQREEEPTFFLHTIITLLFSLVLSLFLAEKWFFHFVKKKNNHLHLPPSPPKLPIIGNLHQLGCSHHSIHSLSRRHGSLMLLYIGSSPALVVSSPEAAQEIFKTHDIVFSNRPNTRMGRRFTYDNKDLASPPHGDYWRQIRKISVSQLLGLKRVQSFQAIREEEVALTLKKISQQSKLKHPSGPGSCGVDLSELFVSLTNDVVCKAAFGRKYCEGEEGRKFGKLMNEFSELAAGFDAGDFIPWLSWLSYVTGRHRRVERVFREFDGLFDRVIDDHVAQNTGNRGMKEEDEMDFVDILLHIQEDNSSGVALARDNIKAILLNVFVGGAEATYTVLEWTMTEMLRHPQVMKEAQKEVRGNAGTKPTITEADTEKMHYLKAVIKETLRIHPPVPLLVPRESSEDVKVLGYDIPAKTIILVNAWTIGRDPEYWEEPEEFRPERFLDTSVDFKGHDFQLIPFGAGRRGCPGITFSVAIIELVLANLLHKFDWTLPGGARLEDLDVAESTGISVHKKLPLVAVPSLHSCF